MTHYIDAEKIIAFLKKEKAEHIIGGDYSDGVLDTCKNMLNFIDSLQQEQNSLPSNLDEAAEKSSQKRYSPVLNGSGNDICYPKRSVFKQGFKAGAEWMAGQGAFYNTKVGWIDGPTVLDWPDDILDKFEMGDEVIVQIRKNNPAKA